MQDAQPTVIGVGDTVSNGLPPSPDRLVSGDAAHPSLVLALDAAGRLDDELAAVLGLLNERSFALAPGLLAATFAGSLESAVALVRLLRECLLDASVRGADLVPAIRERAVRGRINVVMRAIHVLRSRERDVPGSALLAPFRCVRDVCVFLVDRFSQIYAGWTEQHAAIDHQVDTATQNGLRYVAVDDAEIAFARLGREPALSHFLCTSASSQCEEVRRACREIATTLGLALTANEESTFVVAS